MHDDIFKNSVIAKEVSFVNRTRIVCELVIKRKINALGEVKLTNHRVQTVIERIIGKDVLETPQGKKYRSNKKTAKSQRDLFNNN